MSRSKCVFFHNNLSDQKCCGEALGARLRGWRDPRAILLASTRVARLTARGPRGGLLPLVAPTIPLDRASSRNLCLQKNSQGGSGYASGAKSTLPPVHESRRVLASGAFQPACLPPPWSRRLLIASFPPSSTRRGLTPGVSSHPFSRQGGGPAYPVHYLKRWTVGHRLVVRPRRQRQ